MSDKPVDDGRPEEQPPTSVDIHYMKSNLFRVIHADGAVGSLTPRGLLHMTLYNERPAIPKRGVRDISEDQETLSPEKITETIGGVVRELEVDVMMSETFALELRDWLNKRLGDFAAFKEAMAKAEKDKK